MTEETGIWGKIKNCVKAMQRAMLKASPWLILGGLTLVAPTLGIVKQAVGSMAATFDAYTNLNITRSLLTLIGKFVAGKGTVILGVPVATGVVALTAAGACAALFAYKAIKNTPREYEKVKQASAQRAATRQEEEQSQQQEKKRGWLSPITAVLGMGAALLGWKALTKSKTTQTPALAQKTVASVQTPPTPAPTADTGVVEPTHESPYLVSTDGKPVRGGKRKPPRTITPKDHSNTLSA